MIPNELTVDFVKEYPYNAVLDMLYGSKDTPVVNNEDLYDILKRFDPKEFNDCIETRMSPREKIVLYEHYKEHKTFEEIGYSFGVTRERIRQIKNKLLQKLRVFRPCYMMTMDMTPKRVNALLKDVDYYMRLCKEYERHLDRIIGISKVEECNRCTVLETPIVTLNLSFRSYNCLVRAGINTIGELVCRSAEDLMKIRNLGKRSLNEIITVLHDKYNLTLKMEEENDN